MALDADVLIRGKHVERVVASNISATPLTIVHKPIIERVVLEEDEGIGSEAGTDSPRGISLAVANLVIYTDAVVNIAVRDIEEAVIDYTRHGFIHRYSQIVNVDKMRMVYTSLAGRSAQYNLTVVNDVSTCNAQTGHTYDLGRGTTECDSY
jgi:hypothetical protein